MATKNKDVEQKRQGDLFFERIGGSTKNKSTNKMTRNNTNILAHGEVTGHSHRVVTEKGFHFGEDVNVYTDETGLMTIKSEVPFEVEHDEHGKLNFEAGEYTVGRQREYDAINAMRERQVQD